MFNDWLRCLFPCLNLQPEVTAAARQRDELVAHQQAAARQREVQTARQQEAAPLAAAHRRWEQAARQQEAAAAARQRE
eukprot:4063292-Prymnesium_polylepis.1